MSTQNSTVKIKSITKQDEKQYAREQYDRAMANMIANPTDENIKVFENANKFLFEVEDAYRIALRLLLERAQRVGRALTQWK